MRDFVEAVEAEINAAVASAPTKSRLPSGEGVAVTNAALAQRLGLAAATVSRRLTVVRASHAAIASAITASS